MQHEYLGEIVGRPHRSLLTPLSTGRKVYTGDAIGPIQNQDIGKRVYRVNGVIQVESNEQRDRRLGKA